MDDEIQLEGVKIPWKPAGTARIEYYLSYTGVGLPLKLISPIEEGDLERRNTYFRACLDAQDRIIRVERMVYGEVEMVHNYTYNENGKLSRAEIAGIDLDPRVMEF